MNNNKTEFLAKKLRTAGDSRRLQILCYLLSNQKVCVTDIAKEFHLSIAATSHHVRALAKENLLESSREGKQICYTLCKNEFVTDLKKFICKYK